MANISSWLSTTCFGRTGERVKDVVTGKQAELILDHDQDQEAFLSKALYEHAVFRMAGTL
jgi:hypothetical protein